jgi:hypothetical protein
MASLQLNLPDPLPPLRWWQPRRSEVVGVAMGALTGLVAATPLLWMAWEARRAGLPGWAGGGQLTAMELALNWVGGVVVGGLLAMNLARLLLGSPGLQSAGAGRHLLVVVGGSVLVALLAPVPVALGLALAAGQPASIGLWYLLGGGIMGWQPGVIAFVFLYTLGLLEKRKYPVEKAGLGDKS